MTSDAKKLRLLLVEDDAVMARLIVRALEDYFGPGTVRHSATLADAVALDPADFDLVLADMNLPDGTGLDLITAQLARRPDLPIVVITGFGVVDNALQAIRLGACDYIVKAADHLFAMPLMVEKNLETWKIKRENRRLQEELRRTFEEVRVKNQQLEEAVQQLAAMAATDPLTGLANRRTLTQVMEKSFAEAQRYSQDLACIMIDLDGFKLLNDTLGHQSGDRILGAAADILRRTVRKSDTAARYGGDEFIVLLPQTDCATATHAANRIAADFRAAAQALCPDRAIADRITMSMGLACLRVSRPLQAEQLLTHADQALYRAKQLGRNRLEVYSGERSMAAAG